MIDPTAQVHPLAHVEGSSIGPRTKVWQFASVIRNSRVGADCKIASCAIVDASSIDAGSIVSHGAFIDPGMSIGRNVFIGPFVALCNDFWPRTSKEDYAFNDILSGKVIVTVIEDGASIGAGAIVLPGIRIGAEAMIAAGAVVDRDVPANCVFRRDQSVGEIDSSRKIRRVRAAHRYLSMAGE